MKLVTMSMLVAFLTIFTSKALANSTLFTDFTIGGSLNSQVTYLMNGIEPDFEHHNGYSIILNASEGWFNFEIGLEQESFNTDDEFSNFIDSKIDIAYMGLNAPFRITPDFLIIPGIRYGSHTINYETRLISFPFDQTEYFTFAAFALRLQIYIYKDLGVFIDGSIRQILGEDYGVMKFNGGLVYTFHKLR